MRSLLGFCELERRAAGFLVLLLTWLLLVLSETFSRLAAVAFLVGLKVVAGSSAVVS